jgi:putative hydrolase of the HAD superfamily
MHRETLLIDADDTLWENNVFFEQTIDSYVELLEPLGFSPQYILRILNETEKRTNRQHGYGVRSFRRSLEETYLKLAGNMARKETLREIGACAENLDQIPPRILEGVPDTLAYLAERHRLILCTKGEPAEQAAKVERSGLQPRFEAIEIVQEKDVHTYLRIVQHHRVIKSHGWMIGNSPRSDINPALAAGLNAVFIPHSRTWHFEHAELASGPGSLLILLSFVQLREHF